MPAVAGVAVLPFLALLRTQLQELSHTLQCGIPPQDRLPPAAADGGTPSLSRLQQQAMMSSPEDTVSH